mmetsp:Transcript_8796/g.32537  ORF Transcript_8796/g.32537 Transcript_8796/m.32537 type:complete len:386 (-) Transcript_8796:49-1206(-)|eukprot:CAMPEP_0117448238 /NCGR_PEP_ID=MMETSP0759-20121206/7295_1 /TAXON_ID=63605 /ORGANISM="Percolomonas cosmopolitus, Strain WS" /LENGTH=385 /DNA_ID=CAMNT_0005240613 /DNA_START=167 /DNA_END=1324 /DNA_ORIENTATION=-
MRLSSSKLSIFVLLSALVLTFITSTLSQSTECPTCTCRHYVWMGIMLISFGAIIVLLLSLVGVILFKVCVLSRERREDDEIDTKTANRLPYNVMLNITEKKEPKKKKKKQQEEEPEPGKRILGLPYTEERMVLFKAYRLLWNQALAEFGATASTDSLDQLEKLLQLGMSRYENTDTPLLKSTAHRYEKENKKLEPVFDKIRQHNNKNAPLDSIQHICLNLYNTLFRLAHNRGEDVLQERIMIKPDENPYMTVTPFYFELLYPAIFRACTSQEIEYFLSLLFNTSSEACRKGESIIGFSTLSRDEQLQATLKGAFPDLNKLAESVDLKQKLSQPELEVMGDDEDEEVNQDDNLEVLPQKKSKVQKESETQKEHVAEETTSVEPVSP